MLLKIQSDPVPIREDASGALRVGESRVLLELVVNAFEAGETPETIVQRYPTLRLSDTYAVVAYYLRHRADVERYLRRREEQAIEVSRRVNSGQRDLTEIRRRLLAQCGPPGTHHAPPGE
jgi:uncharacterized protein (DUF433 family)